MPLSRVIVCLTLLAEPTLAAERGVIFSISNMTCALCPITVNTAISQVPGVISVEVSQERAQAIVRYDDAKATSDAIATASTNAGYPATEVQAQ